MSNRIHEQLMLLRNLTQTTGVLHDAQLFQLKIWANLIFSYPSEISLPVHDHGMPTKEVLFAIDSRDGFLDGDNRFTAGSLLDASVKDLFGDDWLVCVSVTGTGECAFIGPPREPADNPSKKDDPRDP